MGTNFLIDTNILIYYFKGDSSKIKEFFSHDSFYISAITKIEFLGWPRHTEALYPLAEEFISQSIVLSIDSDIVAKTIALKRESAIKLPDAVIAATALVHNMPLVTRNSDDFKHIKHLKILNPYQ